MNDQEKYSALVGLWTHHNSTQFQWPSLILGAIFVAVSLLVDKVTVIKLVDTTKWGVDLEVQFGAGVPMLIIGGGTTVMLYTMARSRKIMIGLEVELIKLDGSFTKLNHPRGLSGAKLVWRFMALVALATLILGMLFFTGINWYLVPGFLITTVPWIALCVYAWT